MTDKVILVVRAYGNLDKYVDVQPDFLSEVVSERHATRMSATEAFLLRNKVPLKSGEYVIHKWVEE